MSTVVSQQHICQQASSYGKLYQSQPLSTLGRRNISARDTKNNDDLFLKMSESLTNIFSHADSCTSNSIAALKNIKFNLNNKLENIKKDAVKIADIKCKEDLKYKRVPSSFSNFASIRTELRNFCGLLDQLREQLKLQPLNYADTFTAKTSSLTLQDLDLSEVIAIMTDHMNDMAGELGKKSLQKKEHEAILKQIPSIILGLSVPAPSRENALTTNPKEQPPKKADSDLSPEPESAKLAVDHYASCFEPASPMAVLKERPITIPREQFKTVAESGETPAPVPSSAPTPATASAIANQAVQSVVSDDLLSAAENKLNKLQLHITRLQGKPDTAICHEEEFTYGNQLSGLSLALNAYLTEYPFAKNSPNFKAAVASIDNMAIAQLIFFANQINHIDSALYKNNSEDEQVLLSIKNSLSTYQNWGDGHPISTEAKRLFNDVEGLESAMVLDGGEHSSFEALLDRQSNLANESELWINNLSSEFKSEVSDDNIAIALQFVDQMNTMEEKLLAFVGNASFDGEMIQDLFNQLELTKNKLTSAITLAVQIDEPTIATSSVADADKASEIVEQQLPLSPADPIISRTKIPVSDTDILYLLDEEPLPLSPSWAEKIKTRFFSACHKLSSTAQGLKTSIQEKISDYRPKEPLEQVKSAGKRVFEAVEAIKPSFANLGSKLASKIAPTYQRGSVDDRAPLLEDMELDEGFFEDDQSASANYSETLSQKIFSIKDWASTSFRRFVSNLRSGVQRNGDMEEQTPLLGDDQQAEHSKRLKRFNFKKVKTALLSAGSTVTSKFKSTVDRVVSRLSLNSKDDDASSALLSLNSEDDDASSAGFANPNYSEDALEDTRF